MSNKYWLENKEVFDKYIEEYLRPINEAHVNFNKLPFPSLIEELLSEAKRITLTDKVSRIINKCIKSGRYPLAEKIERKYRNYVPKFDSVIAFKMSLLAQRK